VDVCYSPIADIKEFPEVDIALVEGAVANEDHLARDSLDPQRSKILIAFGDCAVTGNVTALRNLFSVEDVLDRAYRENSTVINGVPGGGGDGIRTPAARSGAAHPGRVPGGSFHARLPAHPGYDLRLR
jgi:NAD-reducing hydrogenase small subunit